jgi:fructose/tagatose bisphosphate aldolase
VLMTGTATLLRARREGGALGAFSADNAELATAIVTAAERTGAPVILQAGSSAFGYAGEQLLADVALSAARQPQAPVAGNATQTITEKIQALRHPMVERRTIGAT